MKRDFLSTLQSQEEKLDHMLERRWTFGTWAIIFIIACVGVMGMIFLGNLFIGLD